MKNKAAHIFVILGLLGIAAWTKWPVTQNAQVKSRAHVASVTNQLSSTPKEENVTLLTQGLPAHAPTAEKKQVLVDDGKNSEAEITEFESRLIGRIHSSETAIEKLDQVKRILDEAGGLKENRGMTRKVCMHELSNLLYQAIELSPEIRSVAMREVLNPSIPTSGFGTTDEEAADEALLVAHSILLNVADDLDQKISVSEKALEVHSSRSYLKDSIERRLASLRAASP